MEAGEEGGGEAVAGLANRCGGRGGTGAGRCAAVGSVNTARVKYWPSLDKIPPTQTTELSLWFCLPPPPPFPFLSSATFFPPVPRFSRLTGSAPSTFCCYLPLTFPSSLINHTLLPLLTLTWLRCDSFLTRRRKGKAQQIRNGESSIRSLASTNMTVTNGNEKQEKVTPEVQRKHTSKWWEINTRNQK